MGYQAWCLISEWEPAVAAYRAVGGMDFYWQADEPEDYREPTLPYTVERDFWAGWAFQEAGHFYEALRAYLPAPVARPADAFMAMIYPDSCGAAHINDLADDAGVVPPGSDELLWYAMRPGTAARAAVAADAVAWPQVEAIANGVIDELPKDERYMPDVNWFRHIVNYHVDWVREAADTGRGVIVVQSY